MKDLELTSPLRGIIPPMATPLRDRDALDEQGLERLIDHIIGGGVHGLFILGTTGEGPSLGFELQRELIQQTCEHVSGRVPVLVGITHSSLSESIYLTKLAAHAGAQAVVASTPFYYSVNQADLALYFERLADASPLPVFLYNMPVHTKLVFEPETVQRLLGHPRIVGLKDSSGQMVYFHEVRRVAAVREDFSLLIGPEQLLAETVLLGGHGGVSGGANVFPRLYVDLYNAAAEGNLERTRMLHERVMHVASKLYTVGKDNTRWINGIKCALSCLGICNDRPAEPLQPLSPEQHKEMQRNLESLRSLVGTARTVS